MTARSAESSSGRFRPIADLVAMNTYPLPDWSERGRRREEMGDQAPGLSSALCSGADIYRPDAPDRHLDPDYYVDRRSHRSID